MKYVALALGLAFVTTTAASQAPIWASNQVKDAFRGTEYTEFSLAGKFVTAPLHASSNNPVLMLDCIPGAQSSGKHESALAGAFLYPGHSVADDHGGHSKKGLIRTEYRLDDGKVHAELLDPTTDFKGVSLKAPRCGNCMLDDWFYGGSHKDASSSQVRKIVLNLSEFKGGNVVIQFDLPDIAQVAGACGLKNHK